MVDHHDLASGQYQALIVDVDQKVWIYGNLAELGISRLNIAHNDPRMISDLPPAVSVACGWKHCLILDTDGQVRGFGRNQDGQLGTTGPIVVQPQIIPEWSLLDIVSISAGNVHNLALDREGKVYALGSNLNGQTSVPFLHNHRIVKISAGSHHNLLLDDEGKVFSFGAAWNGRLGRNIYSTQVGGNMGPMVDIKAGDSHNLLLDHNGQVLSFGSNQYGQLGTGSQRDEEPFPVKVPNLENIVQIATGEKRSLALDKNGQVWFAGLAKQNLIRQFTPLRGLPIIRKIASGYKDNLLMDESGQIWILKSASLVQQELRPELLEVPYIVGDKSQPEVSPMVFMSYPLAKFLLDREFFVDYRVRPDLQPSISIESMMEFEDAEGHEYLSIVKYNAPRDLISRPFMDAQHRFYDILKELIMNNKLLEFGFRPDLYQDEKSNEALAFKFSNKIYILIVNKGEDGQIYPFDEFS